MSQAGYIRWPTDAKIPLVLSLTDASGQGVAGASPEVSIRRYWETHGIQLDNYFWNGSSFMAFPMWHAMYEVDAINNPGLYTYIFDQDVVGLEHVYLVQFRNLTAPVCSFVEEHFITNEIYIPKTQPDPVVVGPESVMGQLELVKGLLHHNAMLDRQTFENGLLTSARLRMFDNPASIPPQPGGSETAGLLVEFQLVSAYDDQGLNRKFVLKRVYP